MGNSERTAALIIDDEVDTCFLLTQILKKKNIHSKYVNKLSDAKHVLNNFFPEIVFLDNHLPDGLGIDFIKYIKVVSPHSIIMIITAHDKISLKDKAFKAGATEFINKPFTTEEIHSIMDKLGIC